MRFIYLMLLYFGSALFVSCDTTEPPPEEKPEPIVKSITLSADKFTCTEVWLSVSSENLVLPRNAGVYLGDSLIEQISLNKPDTLLYYEGLLPAKDYTFRMTIPEDTVESNTAAFRTLDTTSHNFTYQTWEFGVFNNSVLYDVAIINENNIWAVGEIFLNDSLGNHDSKRYNAIHWDGNGWEAKRITVDFRGSQITPPLESVFAFSSTDIWFSSGIPIHGDGQNWTLFHLFDMGILSQDDGYLKKIWGTSSSDIYFVGTLGTIAHYNGIQWQKIESGTNLNLLDICGNFSGNVYVSGSLDDKGIILSSYSHLEWNILVESEFVDHSQLFKPKLYGYLNTVWIDEVGTVYTGGNLLFRYKNAEWDYVNSLPENHIGGNPGTYYRGHIFSIRGNASNDYIIAGDRNTLRHYNGSSWSQLGLYYDPQSLLKWRSITMKGDLVASAGNNGYKAVIMILKRN